MRIDLRGSGDSDGLIDDEYSPQEARDVDAVIAWLAEQPWCTGAVGHDRRVLGRLRRAAGGRAQPAGAARRSSRSTRPTTATPTTCTTSAAACSPPTWSTGRPAWPPSSASRRTRRSSARAGATRGASASRRPSRGSPPGSPTSARDDYWRQGSACERYAEITCPVFAIGGWSDGYRDMVLRMVEHVGAPVRGLIGPWGHTGPEAGAPGPAIGFLQEVRALLRRRAQGRGQRLLRRAGADQRTCRSRSAPSRAAPSGPGAGSPTPAWPSPNVATRGARAGRGTPSGRCAGCSSRASTAGVWCGDGGPADGAGRPAARGRRLAVLGHRAAGRPARAARARGRRARAGRRPARSRSSPRGCATSRPTARSSLIARGVLNLTHRDGPRPRRARSCPGEPVMTVRVADAVDVLRGARRPRAAARGLADATGRGSGRRPSR